MGRRSTQGHRRAMAGMTLIGLMFWAIVISFVGYVGLQVAPVVNEYWTIQRAVDRIAASSPATVAEARTAFDRQKDIEYAIEAINGSDLIVTKENDNVVLAYKYEREVPISGPVFLLFKFQGRSK
jgi:hypothetical protein